MNRGALIEATDFERRLPALLKRVETPSSKKRTLHFILLAGTLINIFSWDFSEFRGMLEL